MVWGRLGRVGRAGARRWARRLLRPLQPLSPQAPGPSSEPSGQRCPPSQRQPRGAPLPLPHGNSKGPEGDAATTPVLDRGGPTGLRAGLAPLPRPPARRTPGPSRRFPHRRISRRPTAPASCCSTGFPRALPHPGIFIKPSVQRDFRAPQTRPLHLCLQEAGPVPQHLPRRPPSEMLPHRSLPGLHTTGFPVLFLQRPHQGWRWPRELVQSPGSWRRGQARCQLGQWAAREGSSTQAPRRLHLSSPRVRHTAGWPPRRCHWCRTLLQGCSSPALQPKKGGAIPRMGPYSHCWGAPTHTCTGANFPAGTWIGEGGVAGWPGLTRQARGWVPGRVESGVGTTHPDRPPGQQPLDSRPAHRRAELEAGSAHRCRPVSPGGLGSPAHLTHLHSHPAHCRAGPGAGSGQSCKTSGPPHSLGWHSLARGKQVTPG